MIVPFIRRLSLRYFRLHIERYPTYKNYKKRITENSSKRAFYPEKEILATRLEISYNLPKNYILWLKVKLPKKSFEYSNKKKSEINNRLLVPLMVVHYRDEQYSRIAHGQRARYVR